jgi:hypothetical protein
MAKAKAGDLNGVAELYKARKLIDQGIAPCDVEFSKLYPHLFSLLTNNRIDDKHVIDPPCVRVSNASGDWCFSLAVMSLGMFGEVLVNEWAQGLPELERKLTEGKGFWRPNQKRKPKLRDSKIPEEE